MEFQDYYKNLRISKNASPDEIKRAYRKLARKYHPDTNKKQGAEEKFKQINEAYEVLKDPEKKKLYDAYGRNWQQQAAAEPPHSDGGFSYNQGTEGYSRTFRFNRNGNFEQASGFSDFFSNLFDGGGFDHFHEQQHREEAPRSQEAEITVSLADVFYGATKTISLQSHELDSSGMARPVSKTLNVKIPQGVTDGSVIRLAGQGGMGDLLLRIVVAADPRFFIDGHDLYTIVAVSPWEAALGAKVEVQTIDGSVNLSIPKNSQTGRKFRLRGKGIPRRNGGAGDIIAELEVRMPDNLSSEEEQLFKGLARKSLFNPRVSKQQRAKSHENA